MWSLRPSLRSSICRLFVVLTVAAAVPDRIPKTYLETVVSVKPTNPSHWAFYDDNFINVGNQSFVSTQDDSRVLEPINFCAPYFQMKSAQMYVSSNGFLSPIPVAMCSHFCSGQEATEGFYKANPYIEGGGGDWPIVGLYTEDLDPTSSSTKTHGGTILIGVLPKWGMPEVAIVEYRKVGQYVPDGQVPPSAWLTGQVELWSNGTIILRFKEVLSQYVDKQDPFLATTGLIWSKAQRLVSDTPRYLAGGATSIYAIRYDPVPDGCANETSCTSCLGRANCGWCDSASLCVSTKFATDVCRNGDYRGDPGNCGYWPVGDFNDTTSDQLFYKTTLTSAPWTPIFGNPQATVLFNGTQNSFPLEIALPFIFPLFYNPPVPDANNSRSLRKMYLSRQGYLSATPTQSCITDKYGYCWMPRSSYNLAVAAFVGDLIPATETRISALSLPTRTVGDAFCEAALQASGTKSCPPAVVIEFRNLKAANGLGQTFTMQILLSEDGTVQLRYLSTFPAADYPVPLGGWRCGLTSAWDLFPNAISGILRYGVDDPTSVVIPWTMLDTDTVAVIRAVPGCVDCGVHGRCDATTRKCVCDDHFTGDACSECLLGYYSSSCVPCPKCLNGGTCDDGSDGTGICVCRGAFGGQLCEVACTANRVTCSPACNPFGGYCECGECKCMPQRGWYGPQCDQWQDPCSRYSLDGCEICVSQTDLVCNYCTDHRCYAVAGQFGLYEANLSQCTSSYSKATIGACPQYVPARVPASSLALFVVIVVFIIVGVGACIAIVVFCGCRRRPESVLVTNALTGNPDFDPPRREREVIQVKILPAQRVRPVLGLPLKQIPLKELREWQLAHQKGKSGCLAPAEGEQLEF